VTAADRLEAVVHGRVQGVGFRVFVLRAARRLGLTGLVANDAGRSTVRCIAEGPRGDLTVLLGALHEGPAGARIERVDASWAAATGEFAGFDVRSGWHSGD
jgi:acylphosphatase